MNIFEASTEGNLERVRELIQSGADVNARNYGNTSLHYASENGHTDIVRLLITAGANVNAKNNYDETPLFDASNRGQTDIVRLLIDARADVNTESTSGTTPLHTASNNGHTDIVRLLIDAGADVNAKHNNNTYLAQMTPLHMASSMGHTDIVRLLIDAGADVNAMDMFGKKPINYASTVYIRNLLLNLNSPVRVPEVMPETTDPLAQRLQCNVCMENAVNTRLNPCGHLICSKCFSLLPEPKKCPTCRVSPVTNENIFYGGYYNKLQKYKAKLNGSI